MKKLFKSSSVQKLSIAELDRFKQDSKNLHGAAAKTTANYRGYLFRGQQWLEDLLNGSRSQNIFDCPRGTPESGTSQTWKWSEDDLRHAFDLIPTRASSWALASFLTFKCFQENKGISTADGIHAAFKKYWDNSDPDGLYRGDWMWDEKTGIGRGNPATSPDVMDTLHAIKKKHGAEGVRTHSGAMSVHFLTRIYQWSLHECHIQFPLPTNLLLKERQLIYKHLAWRAFSSFGWTLWTRNFETLKLQRQHLIFNCVTEDDYQLPHWRVVLEQRKNWQSKLDKGQDYEGHTYEIYPQPELPAADVDGHMTNWLSFLESHIYGRLLEPMDFIFPAIGSSGIVQTGVPISHDIIQTWINEFTAGAGIDNTRVKLTTHCFRRGGAQYRFMYAPYGKRWTLATIRWWGGWAEGEHRDTLIRYLLDELHTYEAGHGHALRPIKPEVQASLLGEHKDSQAVTLGDLRICIQTAIKNIVDYIPLRSQPENTASRHHGSPVSCSNNHSSITNSDVLNVCDPHISSKTDIAAPPPDARIPRIASGPKENRWKIVVRDWEHADISRGLSTPLRNWPPEWKSHPALAMSYYHRRLIAEEFIENCNRDETEFLKRWPMAAEGPTAAWNAMKSARLENGISKRRPRSKVPCDVKKTVNLEPSAKRQRLQ